MSAPTQTIGLPGHAFDESEEKSALHCNFPQARRNLRTFTFLKNGKSHEHHQQARGQ
jgi:hypothetical protein